MSLRCGALAIVLVSLAVYPSAAAWATTIDVGHYGLGESDVGAGVGLAGASLTVDDSGNGNDLTLTGSTSYSTGQGSGLSMDFDGASYYSGLALSSGFQNALTRVGVQAWFRVPDEPVLTGTQIIAFSGNPTGSGFGVVIQDGLVRGRAGGSAQTSTNVSLTPGEWMHALWVRHGSGFGDWYINGSLIESFGFGISPGNPYETMIGGNSLSGGSFFTGDIDEVHFFTIPSGSSFDPATDLDPASPSVPEPATLYLCTLVAAAVLVQRRRRR